MRARRGSCVSTEGPRFRFAVSRDLRKQVEDAIDDKVVNDPRVVTKLINLFKDRIQIRGEPIDNVLSTSRGNYVYNFKMLNKDAITRGLKKLVDDETLGDPVTGSLVLKHLGVHDVPETEDLSGEGEKGWAARLWESLGKKEEPQTFQEFMTDAMDGLLKLKTSGKRQDALRNLRLDDKGVELFIREFEKRAHDAFKAGDRVALTQLQAVLDDAGRTYGIDAKAVAKRLRKREEKDEPVDVEGELVPAKKTASFNEGVWVIGSLEGRGVFTRRGRAG